MGTHTKNGLPILTREVLNKFSREELNRLMERMSNVLFDDVNEEQNPENAKNYKIAHKDAVKMHAGISIEELKEEQPTLANYIQSICQSLGMVAMVSDGDICAIQSAVEVGMLRMYKLLEIAEENARKG